MDDTGDITASAHCQWCGNAFSGTAVPANCPRCGAPLQLAVRRDDAGWTQLPPVADMARIQFGNSSVQIEGHSVPVADFKVGAGNHIYFSHHYLLWRDDQVTLKQMSLRGGLTRMFAGLPVFMLEAHGPGRMAISRDEPGETLAVPLNPGQAVHVLEHKFLAATGNVAYGCSDMGIFFTLRKTTNTEDLEYVYPVGRYLDVFRCGNEPGLLLLNCAGNCFMRHLSAGETLLVKPRALIYTDATVHLGLHFEYPRHAGMLRRRHIWMRIKGPGRAAIQSCYNPIEEENSPYVNEPFGATSRAW
jgi:uncharacterized protein (AIM24 family)